MTKEILLFGDALEEMDMLIKQGVKVDAILTDIPYGVTACKWDIVIPFEPMWERLKLIRKDRTPIALFGTEPFSSMLRMSNLKEYKYDWVWKKQKASNFFRAYCQPLKSIENISVFYKKQCLYNPIYEESTNNKKVNTKAVGKYKNESGLITNSMSKIIKNSSKYKSDYNLPHRILYFNTIVRNKKHSTQKPLDLMKYFVLTYTNPGDTVLDFTCGSGTTICACKELNRNSIGIENDRKTFNLAKNRIKNHPSYQEIKA